MLLVLCACVCCVGAADWERGAGAGLEGLGWGTAWFVGARRSRLAGISSWWWRRVLNISVRMALVRSCSRTSLLMVSDCRFITTLVRSFEGEEVWGLAEREGEC